MSAPIRLSRTALDQLSGSQAWYDVKSGTSGEEPAVLALFARLVAAEPRRDGSVTIEVDAEDVAILLDYAEAWVWACADVRDVEGLGELNSARALVRRLRAIPRDEPTTPALGALRAEEARLAEQVRPLELALREVRQKIAELTA